MSEASQGFNGWAVLELMGHVRIAGKVSQEEQFGTKLGRIDIPQRDGTTVTQFFGGSSVYRLTPVSEEAARAVAANCRPEPVHAWELPQRLPAPTPARTDDYEDDVPTPDDDDF